MPWAGGHLWHDSLQLTERLAEAASVNAEILSEHTVLTKQVEVWAMHTSGPTMLFLKPSTPQRSCPRMACSLQIIQPCTDELQLFHDAKF